MTKTDFTDAGFIVSLDPQFRYEYDLSDRTDTFQEHDYKPVLLWDNISCQFCVTDGEAMFIYFNAENPADAVKWANMITHFEPN